MKLTTQQAYELLAKYGSYITELCDACGKGIGPVRFTRAGDSGVWCSRECRDGKEAYAPGTCKYCHATLPKEKRRGAAFCDETCRQAAHRSKRILEESRTTKISVTKPSIYAGFSSKNSGDGVAGHPGQF